MVYIIQLLQVSFLALCLASDGSAKKEDKRVKRSGAPQSALGPIYFALNENQPAERWAVKSDALPQVQASASPATENALNYAFQSQGQNDEYLSQEALQSSNEALNNRFAFILPNQHPEQTYTLKALQDEQALNLNSNAPDGKLALAVSNQQADLAKSLETQQAEQVLNLQNDQQHQLNSLSLLNEQLKLENAELNSKLGNGNQNIWQAPGSYFGLTSEQAVDSKNKALDQQPDFKTALPLAYSFSNIAYGPNLLANYELQQQNQLAQKRHGSVFLLSNDEIIDTQGRKNAAWNKNSDANELSGQALVDRLVKARYLSGSIDQYQPQDTPLPTLAKTTASPSAATPRVFNTGFGKLSLSNLAVQQLVKSLSHAPSIPIGQKVEIVKHVPYAVIRHIPVHVPQPYAVPVPHAVRVAIPQPYPVHVEVEKPVPYPVIKLQKVIVEKRVPYAVEKLVPYAVDKPYPVPIVKKVHIPVDDYSAPAPITIARINKLKRPSWHK